MKYRKLGRTGLFVSELALGTATFAGGSKLYTKVGALTQEKANSLVRIAVDAGVNLFDTADVYSEGMAEEMLGKAVRDLGLDRSRLVIATKVGDVVDDDPNAAGASRRHIEHSIGRSLDRLQMDYVDLYQIHDFDPVTPIDETLDALDDLVHRGLVRYVGVSNWAAWQIGVAQGIVQTRGTTPLCSLQAYYSLVSRDIEREVIPAIAYHGMGLLIWGPLAGGSLTGKYRHDADGRRRQFDFPPIDDSRLAAILAIADEISVKHKATPAQIALTWLLQQRAVSSIVIGATSERQLLDNLAARHVLLDPADITALNQASELHVEYPAWMQELKGASRRRFFDT